jgi:cytochrome b6-f complex iron-sulfur subunit
MAKKLSVAEILAAARAEKAGGGAPAAPSTSAADNAPAVAKEESASPAPVIESAPAASAPAASPPAGGKVAPGGKGMSMADILAAARAKPGAAKPAVAEKAVKAAVSEKPAKPAVAEKAAPKPAAPKPTAAKEGNGAAPAPKDTASILAAARTSAKPGPMTKAEAAAKAVPAAPAGKKKIEVPPMPAKPAYARPEAATAADGTTRRTFFAAAAGVLFGSSIAVGFTSLAVTHLMWLLGLARFMFPNILIEPPTRFKVGFPDQFAPGQVETKFIPQFGVWIVRYEFDGQPMVYALKSVCTHLGCTPNWLEAEQKFKCPCHGSGFYKDGVNFEGPAPRPLERYAISLAEDGQLLVDKSRTFQQELGQWKDAASYVSV